MPPSLPTPTLTLSIQQARRFMLVHQGLLTPRRFDGKDGILEFIRQVGCIQFDPLNVVGRNPDLILQSRIEKYRPELLETLLYRERQLLDGWDKMAGIYSITDWPYFSRHRDYMRQVYFDSEKSPLRVAIEVKAAVSEREVPATLIEQQDNALGLTWEQVRGSVLTAIRDRGPLCSNDLKDNTTIDWSWGKPTRLSKAVMETLFATGELVIHHRTGTRRYFDLTERHVPAEILNSPDPNGSEEDYQDWHVLRRVGGISLASPRSSEYWLGLRGVKSEQRSAALHRLVEKGDLVAVAVEGLDDRTLFMRTADLPELEPIQQGSIPAQRAAIIAALDNLIWDRQLTRMMFDFDYTWEVYKPKAKRQYGYYVLPVIYGDRFIARFDPSFDKQKRILTINNWWWERDVQLDDEMEAALIDCFLDFNHYLDANKIIINEKLSGDTSMTWFTETLR